MDLYAYSQIESLEEIAKKNNIYVPRLRGYRLMKDELPSNFSNEEYDYEVECVKELCTSIPFWNPNADMCEYSSRTDCKRSYYIETIENGDEDVTERIRWNRIHGKKRRILKTFIHNERKRFERQKAAWDKYAGREDVLYIHARLGGANWPYYHAEVDTKPWFLEKVDDSYDSTYCDIYAKIEV